MPDGGVATSSTSARLNAFLYPDLPERIICPLRTFLYDLTPDSVTPQPERRIILPVQSTALVAPEGPRAMAATDAERAATDEEADRRSRNWWHPLMPNGLRISISRSPDIYLRFPATPPPDEAAWTGHCVRNLTWISKNRYFYIGITDNPADRWARHVCSGFGWSTMDVMVIASSSRLTAALERALIHRFRSPLRCANVGGGGECASYGSPHFLYVVYRSDSLMRRPPGSSGGSRFSASVAADLAFHSGMPYERI